MKQITVIGSISMDFVVTTEQVPAQGETLFGETFNTYYGGKGANQAVAASRLGGAVTMLGAVGNDVFGKEVLGNLKTNKISTAGVKVVDNQHTGVANIVVHEGDNRIIYVPGANDAVTIADVKAQEQLLLASEMVIIQNETPLEVIELVISFCHEHKIKTIYNPAPAREISATALEQVSYLTPNESEFGILFPNQTLETVLKKFPNKLIVTLGSQGAIFYDGTQLQRVPAFKVTPVDTTGAGDTFNGALAVALSYGLSVEESLKFGNLASSLAVQVKGAQDGIPTISTMKGQVEYEEAWHFEQ